MLKSSKLKVKKKYFKLRHASLKDSRFLLELHNSNIMKKKFFSKKKILLKNHINWLNEKLKNKMLFICISKYRIGYIRYDKLNRNNLSVSIAVKEKYKRKVWKINVEKFYWKKHISKFSIYAYVKDSNLISKKFFV